MTIIKERELPDKHGDFPKGLHPVLERVLLNRDVFDSQAMDYSLANLLPFSELHDIEKAAALLSDSIRSNRKILIVADYDADGATSCAVAIRALHDLGAGDVEYIVPNRFKYGYGLTPGIAELVLERKPDLVVTVDNGISSIDGIAMLKESGVKVLVTDHHLAGESLPNADAIVNPNQVACQFKSKNIAGVGVIFYVLLALRTSLRDSGWFESSSISEPNFSSYLDLVALGTVADVVKLDKNNRVLVRHGLRRITSGDACAGIKALIEVSNCKTEKIVSSDLGFSIAPKLNAAGRLEDMSLGIECLLSDDYDRCLVIANELNDLNVQRKQIEKDMRTEALNLVEKLAVNKDGNADLFGYCLYQADWHEGVIGIIAGRMKDKLHRPVIVFAQSDNGILKGSARSIPGVHIRDILDSIATRHPEIISKFGGHAMAAGLSINESSYEQFQLLFNQAIEETVDPAMLNKVIYSDGQLTAKDINLEFTSLIQQYGPWGQGFPEPVFDGVFDIVNKRIVGENHLKLTLRLSSNSDSASDCFDAIAFNVTDEEWPANTKQVKLAYQLDINEFRDRITTQLMVNYIEPI